ncbi:hypothetical protein ACN0TX_12080 [Staphylococcus cohnii]
MERMDIDYNSKEMFLIDTAIHLYSGADRESYEMRNEVLLDNYYLVKK